MNALRVKRITLYQKVQDNFQFNDHSEDLDFNQNFENDTIGAIKSSLRPRNNRLTHKDSVDSENDDSINPVSNMHTNFENISALRANKNEKSTKPFTSFIDHGPSFKSKIQNYNNLHCYLTSTKVYFLFIKCRKLTQRIP